ncbi:MAG: hypothetical protein ACLQQ4_17980 [Bacteroidia bacterium]
MKNRESVQEQLTKVLNEEDTKLAKKDAISKDEIIELIGEEVYSYISFEEEDIIYPEAVVCITTEEEPEGEDGWFGYYAIIVEPKVYDKRLHLKINSDGDEVLEYGNQQQDRVIYKCKVREFAERFMRIELRKDYYPTLDFHYKLAEEPNITDEKILEQASRGVYEYVLNDFKSQVYGDALVCVITCTGSEGGTATHLASRIVEPTVHSTDYLERNEEDGSMVYIDRKGDERKVVYSCKVSEFMQRYMEVDFK